MIINKYRAAGDLNRWAIRPEIEPQLRLRFSNLPVTISSRPQPSVKLRQPHYANPKLGPNVLRRRNHHVRPLYLCPHVLH